MVRASGSYPLCQGFKSLHRHHPAELALLGTLERSIGGLAPSGARLRLVVGYSGGPDSTALLYGLTRLRERMPLDIFAAHLDHGLDRDSARRAEKAGALARHLAVELVSERRDSAPLPPPGQSAEEAARLARYTFLEQCRQWLRADWIVTAHHRGDQVETVLLRLLQGSGLFGLAGMQPLNGRLVRPLLELDRHQLSQVTAALGVDPVHDVTNDRPHCARNRLRLRLLPVLEAREPGLADAVSRLASAASAARGSLRRRLPRELDMRRQYGIVSLSLARFRSLEAPLQRLALSVAGWVGDVALPVTAGAFAELRNQLQRSSTVGCDCGGGLRLESDRDRLFLLATGPALSSFSYTLKIPGAVWIPERSLGIRVGPSDVSARQANGGRCCLWAHEVPLRLEVRTRRPGDWMQPPGGRRRLVKDIMSSAKLARPLRQAVPLICDEQRVLWAPHLATPKRLSWPPHGPHWIAELIEDAGLWTRE